ncbi:MAG: hypothetical protein NVSMB52_05170 [Chloroflexota bacterium]
MRSGAAGAVVSAGLWYVLTFLPYLRFFLALFVGAAVGETMSRLARRRSAVPLQVLAVAVTVVGLVVVESLRLQSINHLASGGGINVVPLIVPGLVASYVAVIKLR